MEQRAWSMWGRAPMGVVLPLLSIAVAVGVVAAFPEMGRGPTAVMLIALLATSIVCLKLNADMAQAIASCRRAEEALQGSTDVLRSMVSALPVGVITVDRTGRVEMWNQAAEAILGYGAEEMVGKPAPSGVFFSYPDKRSAADVFLRMVTGELVKGEEVQCRRKDGSVVDTTLSGAPLTGEDHRLRGAICVFEDISQRKAIAHQLQQAQKMEAVGQLTGGLAHDFNNILGVAIGNLDLLATELVDRPHTAEMVETALNALLRGAELTRALLAFSRRQPLRPVRVDVAELLSSITRMLGRTLGGQIKLGLQIEADLWPVMVDPAQLESSITNLVINSRDAMPDGGTLTITARNAVLDEEYTAQVPDLKPGSHVLIEVTDTGTGIPPDMVQHVFEPFYTTKGVGHGTGLGLSMVFGFIKQSGGHIRIYSEVGRGTTVRLYLPRAPEEIVEVGVESGVPELVRGNGETVLAVEDNDDVRRMAEGLLSGLGYRVLTAPNGPAAMGVIDSDQSLDLLFTDVVMPEGMTGFQLAEYALRCRPGLKVLITSGFPGCTIGGGNEGDSPPWPFLSKPYRRQELARMVRDVLDGKAVRR